MSHSGHLTAYLMRLRRCLLPLGPPLHDGPHGLGVGRVLDDLFPALVERRQPRPLVLAPLDLRTPGRLRGHPHRRLGVLPLHVVVRHLVLLVPLPVGRQLEEGLW